MYPRTVSARLGVARTPPSADGAVVRVCLRGDIATVTRGPVPAAASDNCLLTWRLMACSHGVGTV